MSLKQRLGFDVDPLYLMDGTAFLFRGFFANAAMSRSDGLATGALYIVGRVLLKLFREERPSYFAFILDGPGKHFRHELLPTYKANRPAPPEGLIAQIEPMKRMVASFGLRCIVSEGCEADDCIASLAARGREERPVVIIGMDKDLRQCLAPNVVLWDPASREEKLITLDSFREQTGLEPSQWPDVQALIGDSSDNVPGVRGIGEKTAEKLFRDFPSLEYLRDHMDEVPSSVRKKLEGNEEAMFLYRELTRLNTECCTDVGIDDLRVRPLPGERPGQLALSFLREYEMGSLQRELSALMQRGLVDTEGSRTDGSGVPERAGEQLSLLSVPVRKTELLPRVTDAALLPSCAGKPVALTPPPFSMLAGRRDGNALVASIREENGTEKEYLYEGSQAALAAWAAGASGLVTPDVKRLLRGKSAWKQIPPARWFDLGLAAYLLAPEDRDYGWPRLSSRHAEATGLDPERPGLLAFSLHDDLKKRLAAADLERLLLTIEQPLTRVLADMEETGVCVDLAALDAFLQEVQHDLDQLTADIYEAAGGPFNIRSAQQMGEVLFKRLGLTAPKSTKGGQASTSQDVLEKLSGRHAVVDRVLEFRKLEKMRSTYLEPLPRHAGPDGRIHTTFNQTATATGRLSSSNPNLQNIPVRGDMGRRMRSCFIAGPGRILVSADYSQIELRVLAHYSQDSTLLAAFRNGEDIHTRTAALLNDIEPSAVTADQRRGAKTINFGLIYGMGARKLAGELGISLAEAREFMDRYFARFARIREFYDRVEEDARSQGYVTTMADRRRPLPDMHSQSAQSRALAERQAVNTLIQGSAADIIKLAMLAVHEDEKLRSLSARLILQVHDELLLEVPEEYGQEAGERLAALMSNLENRGVHLDVPLVVDWGVAHDWGAAH
ncbi:MAG TPA: DNA polymerase I [Candidatus Mailhella merdavium]|nr:DNA polymerase I [Candidatus Mailhella merdavium]